MEKGKKKDKDDDSFNELYSEEEVNFNKDQSQRKTNTTKNIIKKELPKITQNKNSKAASITDVASIYLGKKVQPKKRATHNEPLIKENINKLESNNLFISEKRQELVESPSLLIDHTIKNTIQFEQKKKTIQVEPLKIEIKQQRQVIKPIQREKSVPKFIQKDKSVPKFNKTEKSDDVSWNNIKNKLSNEAKQKNIRLEKLERAKEILSGKVSIIWIYVVEAPISEDLRDRIYNVYKGLLDDENIVPFCKKAWEIEPFLKIPNTYFKIVSDLNNMELALKYKINIKIVQYYIYNNQSDKGVAKALELKGQTKKVKGIFTNLQKIIERTEEQIEDTIQIFKFNNSFEVNAKQNKFPSFLKLTGKDKSEATLYRGNLYGAIKISNEEKNINFEYFMALVKEKYGSVVKEQKNIKDYIKINHQAQVQTKDQAREIISFYVRESFYYIVTNSMLRTLKTTEEFKPCILPFNEIYHSIKLFYQLYLTEHNKKVPAMTLYRGARLKKKDFEQLKPGDFFEMYGFMSTSKELKTAQKFTDSEGYIFVIHVKEREIIKKYEKYDHGFVDINRYKLAESNFSSEEEVLFNALNVFRVQKIDDSGQNIMIHIQYAAVFDLLEKPKDTLTLNEKDILINYQYCTKLMNDIEDQGDVYLLASQFEEAKGYYIQKINKNVEDASSYLKLANVQKQCGEIDQAEKNGKKSLELLNEKIDLNDKETCMKVFSIHSKNAEINFEKEDYLHADEELSEGIELLDDSQIFEKAKKIRERGEIKFKKGEVREAERDFEMSEKLFLEVQKQGEKQKSQINRRYIISLFTLWCSDQTKEQLDKAKEDELHEIQEKETQISEMRQEIEDQLIRVNKSLKEVATYVEDKDKYQHCIKKARAYLVQVQARQTNDPREKAKLKVIEATIQDYLELAESEKLLADAIALIQSETPFDPSVGEYSTILAKLQKKQMQKFTNPTVNIALSPDHKVSYNQQQHQEVYGRCKSNFQKAINVLLYNSKTKDAPEVLNLKNQLGELEFGQANFKSCEEIIKDIKQSSQKVQHTEVAKTELLLAKIALSRGELKNSFETLKSADTYLQTALIKSRQNLKYIKIYENSDCYMEIVFHRTKVYNKQMNHDMSLRELKSLELKVNEKMDGYDSHNLTASIYDQYGEIQANLGQTAFEQSFMKAIQLRTKQMGKYNLQNAISYCNYAKYLMLFHNMNAAQENLNHAIQIFSCMSNDHPINWIVHFANGVFRQMKEDYVEADQLMKSSLRMAEQKFDNSHITIKKVRLRLAKILIKKGDIQESFKELQKLEGDVDESLKESQCRIEIVDEIDDEKITLQKIILSELRSTIENQQNGIRFSQVEVDKYRKKYSDLRKTFRIEGQEMINQTH